jgi:hypothetical protein
LATFGREDWLASLAGAGSAARAMRLLLLHVHVVHRHIRAMGRIFVDRSGGALARRLDLLWRKPPLVHLLDHGRQLLVHHRGLQPAIRARRGLSHHRLGRLTAPLEPVPRQHPLAVTLQKIQHPCPFLLRVILQRRHRRASLPLPSIPV